MLYLYILIGILAGASIITIITASIIESIKTKISKEVITQVNLKDYEKRLEDYLDKKNITRKDLLELCRGTKIDTGSNSDLKINIQEVSLLSKKLNGDEAGTYEDGNGGYIVYVADNLSTKSNHFVIAHEIGHLVMGDPLPVKKKWHGLFIRNKKEQISDYIAAAILLPMDEFSKLLKQVNYDSLDKKRRMKFIEDLSDEKDVDKEVIMKRIVEFRIINGETV